MARASLKDKQVIYRQVFGSEAGKEVLRDLNVFCNGTKAHKGDNIERQEGRREVFLQIMRMVKIDIIEVFEEYIEDDF